MILDSKKNIKNQKNCFENMLAEYIYSKFFRKKYMYFEKKTKIVCRNDIFYKAMNLSEKYLKV